MQTMTRKGYDLLKQRPRPKLNVPSKNSPKYPKVRRRQKDHPTTPQGVRQVF
jgi:hypothetical protein